jgi:hypothetical protein
MFDSNPSVFAIARKRTTVVPDGCIPLEPVDRHPTSCLEGDRWKLILLKSIVAV